MTTHRPNQVALFGPIASTLIALGLAAVVLSYYGDFIVGETDRAAVVGLASALAEDAPSSVQRALGSAREAGYEVRIIETKSRDNQYAFLRSFSYVDLAVSEKRLDGVNKTDANLWVAAELGRRFMADGAHLRGLQFVPPNRAIIVEGKVRGADLGSAYLWLFLTMLAGLCVWGWLLKQGQSRPVRTLFGPIVTAMGMSALLLMVLAELEAGAANLLGTPEFGWGARHYAVFALPLMPLIWSAIQGWINQGQASPNRVAYTYIAPAVIGLSVLVLLPFLFGVCLSFFRFSQGDFSWVGLAHFIEILTNQDYPLLHPLNFYFTLGVTVLWTALNVFLHVAIGLALALLLNRPDLKLKGVYRVLLIVPWAVPSYITALVWKGMFNQQFGVINALLTQLGSSPVDWFGSFGTAFSANVATNTWLGFPFMMVVTLGALQSIPSDLYEAAEVDGASRWQAFRHITIPLLRPALLPAVIMGSVWTFNMFNIVYLVSGGRPDGSTDILITEAYRWAFERERYGYAAAYSLVIFFVLLAYSALTQRAGRESEASAS